MMWNYIRKYATVVPVSLSVLLFMSAQSTDKPKTANDFPQLTFTSIPGAPALSQPSLIMTNSGPVLGGGLGWAAPFFYDLDNDGRDELLIGEFGSLAELSMNSVGNFVRVYKNTGSRSAPLYSANFDYLMYAKGHGNGTPISIYTWCCIGFTPRFVDIDGDGTKDLITGSYYPGDVTYFKGLDKGFSAGQIIPQYGDQGREELIYDPAKSRYDVTSPDYWYYSSADFYDLDGDGLVDALFGGESLRWSKNIGTSEAPQFGERKLLLDLNGQPLRLYVDSVSIKNGAGEPYYGDHMIPTFADWDQDGVVDLFVTGGYTHPGYQHPVMFYKGEKSGPSVRFHKGIPLFTGDDALKAFPGTNQQIAVTDYNGDGVLDIVIGTRVACQNDVFAWDLNWDWKYHLELPKVSPAHLTKATLEGLDKTLLAIDSMRIEKGLTEEEWDAKYTVTKKNALSQFYGNDLQYRNLSYQGYVYVLLGRKNND